MTRDAVWHAGSTARSDRVGSTTGVGVTIWLTGLSGSGKSTIAYAVEKRLIEDGTAAYVLDGDNLRHGINADLGFSKKDRAENVRRVGEIARIMADAGLVVLVPIISPYLSDREGVRRAHAAADVGFFEVFVDAPLEVCESRDPKGLYARARAGKLDAFTGVSDPYEPPSSPDIRIDTTTRTVSQAVESIIETLSTEGTA